MIAPTSRRVIPAPSARFVDENGVIDDQWYGFLRALYTRTGGAIGNGVVTGQPPPDLTALQVALAGLTVATADLPAVRVSLAATALALADVQTLAAVQADPDPAPPPFDPSDLYTLVMTLPDDAVRLPSDDPLILAILASD